MIPGSADEVDAALSAVPLVAASAATDGDVGDCACRCSPLEQDARITSEGKSKMQPTRRRPEVRMMVMTYLSSHGAWLLKPTNSRSQCLRTQCNFGVAWCGTRADRNARI